MNRLSSTAIRDKIPLNIWSGGVAGLLWVFECLTYFNVIDEKLNPRAKKFVFLGVKKNMKGYRLWDPEIKRL